MLNITILISGLFIYNLMQNQVNLAYHIGKDFNVYRKQAIAM